MGIRIDVDASQVKAMMRGKLAVFQKYKIQRAVREGGQNLFNDMQLRTPVRTGRLRRSERIEFTEGGFEIYVGDEDTRYWKFVEWGTSRMKAQPYIRPAILTWFARIERAVKRIVESG